MKKFDFTKAKNGTDYFKAAVKYILTVAFALAIAVAATGCKSDILASVPDSQKLMHDLANDKNFFSEQEVQITDLSVIKRQTTVEDKIDLVYVEVNAENELINCTLSYKMTYRLYNDGWVLDEVEKYDDGTNKIGPLTEPDDEFVLNDLDKKIDESGTNGYYSTEGYYWDYKPSIKSVEPHLDDGYCTYTVTCLHDEERYREQKEIEVNYYYDATTNSWYSGKITETVKSHRIVLADEIEGYWCLDSRYSDSYIKGIFAGIYIEITNVSEEQGTMDLLIGDNGTGEIYYNGTYDVEEISAEFHDSNDISFDVFIRKSVSVMYWKSYANSGGPYNFVRIGEASVTID